MRVCVGGEGSAYFEKYAYLYLLLFPGTLPSLISLPELLAEMVIGLGPGEALALIQSEHLEDLVPVELYKRCLQCITLQGADALG